MKELERYEFTNQYGVEVAYVLEMHIKYGEKHYQVNCYYNGQMSGGTHFKQLKRANNRFEEIKNRGY